MKRRINIWATTNDKGNKNSTNLQKDVSTGSTPPHYQQNDNVQSTFEYEKSKPIPEANFYDEIEHEDGDYPIQDRHIDTRGGGGILKLRQKRRSSLSVAVSEEEKELLRNAARKKGMTFSNWARKTLFRSAGLSMPKRPK